jgi:hypothetical protein
VTLTNGGELFDLSEAPFKEIPVAKDTTDAAARKHLQQVLDQHPAAPGQKEISKAEKKAKRAARKKQAA